MDLLKNRTTWGAAVAIFAMFFGSGNAVFPLDLGRNYEGQLPFAMMGLMFTAVGTPLLGLLVGTLYQGNTRALFGTAGRLLGPLFLAICVLVVGPTGAMARCVVVAHEAARALVPNLPMSGFSILFAGVSLLLAFRRGAILEVLGGVLSPILLACLFAIIGAGLWIQPVASESVLSVSAAEALQAGVLTGYDTLDLLASLVFAAAVWQMLLGAYAQERKPSLKQVAVAGSIAMLLLGLVYGGLMIASGLHSHTLSDLRPEQLLPAIGTHLLGQRLSIVSNIAVLLACLTTVLSLAATLSQMLYDGVLWHSVPYRPSLVAVLMLTTLLANVGFSGIQAFVHPLAQLCYPAVIVWVLLLLARQTFAGVWVKVPTVSTFGISLLLTFV